MTRLASVAAFFAAVAVALLLAVLGVPVGFAWALGFLVGGVPLLVFRRRLVAASPTMDVLPIGITFVLIGLVVGVFSIF